MATTVVSISVTAEDKRNIEKIRQARPDAPFSRLVRELIAKEAARLQQQKGA